MYEQQAVRYEMRNQIEQVIKDKYIDRMRFHEVSKSDYQGIINKFYYSFFDYVKYPKIQFNYLWLRFHKRLETAKRLYGFCDWEKYIDGIDNILPASEINKQFYLILDYGWVYEGYLQEIKIILKNTEYIMTDFYIVSKKYDWLICHCDDGDCMTLILD